MKTNFIPSHTMYFHSRRSFRRPRRVYLVDGPPPPPLPPLGHRVFVEHFPPVQQTTVVYHQTPPPNVTVVGPWVPVCEEVTTLPVTTPQTVRRTRYTTVGSNYCPLV
mgnify:CR=1 FL=1